MDLGVEVGYIFRNDDFCSTTSFVTTCYKEVIRQNNQAGAETNITQEISDDYYFLEITLGFQTVTYEFDKISENQIISTNSLTGIQDTYIKQ